MQIARAAVKYADEETASVCEGAIEAARRHALGDASDEELAAAMCLQVRPYCPAGQLQPTSCGRSPVILMR